MTTLSVSGCRQPKSRSRRLRDFWSARPTSTKTKRRTARSSTRAITRELDLAVEVPGSPLDAVMSGEVWDEVYDRLAQLISHSSHNARLRQHAKDGRASRALSGRADRRRERDFASRQPRSRAAISRRAAIESRRACERWLRRLRSSLESTSATSILCASSVRRERSRLCCSELAGRATA